MRWALRTLIRLMLLGAVVAGVVVLWRRWQGPWPITPQPEPEPQPAADPAPADSTPAPPSTPPPPAAAAVASSTTVEQAWVAPADGQCPDGYPVKGNKSGIYHVPGGRFYQRTIAERCYPDPETAERDGYRRAKV